MTTEESGRKRSHLGRGLDALFGEDEAGYEPLDRLRQSRLLPIEHLAPNPYQPRRNFDDESLEQLVQSVRERGILQPILARPLPGAPDRYQIIAGERRWRAAQRAELHEVPVLVRELSDEDALQIALIENVQRQDLSPLEEAEGYRRLIAEFGHTQEALARTIGKSRSHIANTLRLLELPAPVQSLVQQGQLTAGHARALITSDDSVSLAREVVDKGLNVRQTEALVRTNAQGEDQPGLRGPRRSGGTGAVATAVKDADTLALENELSGLLGLRVTIANRSDQAGTLTVHYATLEQLEDVVQRLGQIPRPA